MTSLRNIAISHGFEPAYPGPDGNEQHVPDEVLRELVAIFELTSQAERAPAGIAEALAEPGPPRCFVPEPLRDARIWGVTTQLPALVSRRNLGMGDFADLAQLARIVADEGGDFLGVNPLHAMFWSDPARISPFSPSNRELLDARFLALDWIEGFDGLTAEEASHAARLHATPRVQTEAASALKDRVLRRIFAGAPMDHGLETFISGKEALRAHAEFETVSAAMVQEGHGAGWMGWPEPFRHRHSDEVAQLLRENEEELRFHLWLQYQADLQLARVQREALAAGMRVGLYLDVAVGTAPDGSATWAD
ncbi:MAG TPA: 4-alpha-glucanotransferase, partial [Paracoccaceae bacterium]|nr:4-alpha-glucanotransferase [Paracoccaceae bacterium]